ncbi:hypothetical protein Bpfe_030103 [Biomphalaria pfeifferi]|uniref:Uncharacterized protein n=1 Tax=Biomphalaria pfeifferi TaxID=112525 RepID=A0AAD8AT44_BIOPF|nr:hypothetical protein Bpfe_030103 [Biomphalaria pfeifferi]
MAKKYAEGDNTPYSELQVQEDHLPPKLSRLRTILLNFTQYGLNFMVLLLSVVVVPAQVEKMSGGTHKGRTMGGMVAGGAGKTFFITFTLALGEKYLRQKSSTFYKLSFFSVRSGAWWGKISTALTFSNSGLCSPFQL